MIEINQKRTEPVYDCDTGMIVVTIPEARGLGQVMIIRLEETGLEELRQKLMKAHSAYCDQFLYFVVLSWNC